MDEWGSDQNNGVLGPVKNISQEACLTWCGQQDMATGCEYKIDERECYSHTWSVSSGNGIARTICSVILPHGMFLIYI